MIERVGAERETEETNRDYISLIKQLNESPVFILSGVAGLADIQSPSTSGGTFSGIATIRATKFVAKKNGWIDPLYVMMGFNARTSGSEDSSDLVKTFLFPHIGKRDFILGTYLTFSKNDWTISPRVEGSLNRFKVEKDSIVKKFFSSSLVLGCDFVWSALVQGDTAIPVGFSLFPYYTLINVQPKHFAAYNSILNGSRLPPTMHAFGLQATLQASRVAIFCDMRYFINYPRETYLEDFKAFTYTLGAVLTVDALRLRRFRIL